MSAVDSLSTPSLLLVRLVGFVQTLVGLRLGEGGLAVDATAGNGHDTAFLAEGVGETGHVYAFDVQQRALRATDELLVRSGLRKRVTLLHAGHETMDQALPPQARGRVDAIMFNLGYLPGTGRKPGETVITRSETTCAAIRAGLQLLRPGGLLSLVLYTGHAGGPEEAEAVERFCAALSTDEVQVLRCAMHNHADPRVRALLLEKMQAPPTAADRA